VFSFFPLIEVLLYCILHIAVWIRLPAPAIYVKKRSLFSPNGSKRINPLDRQRVSPICSCCRTSGDTEPFGVNQIKLLRSTTRAWHQLYWSWYHHSSQPGYNHLCNSSGLLSTFYSFSIIQLRLTSEQWGSGIWNHVWFAEVVPPPEAAYTLYLI
jgi:hypothetical protein